MWTWVDMGKHGFFKDVRQFVGQFTCATSATSFMSLLVRTEFVGQIKKVVLNLFETGRLGNVRH